MIKEVECGLDDKLIEIGSDKKDKDIVARVIKWFKIKIQKCIILILKEYFCWSFNCFLNSLFYLMDSKYNILKILLQLTQW